MAYVSGNLSKVAELGVNGGTLWYYPTLDSAATVAGSGYFTGDTTGTLRVGDVIMRVTFATGTPAVPLSVGTYGFHIVLTNDGTTVNLSDSSAATVGTTVADAG